MEKGRLMQTGMSSSLSPCSARATKKLRRDDKYLFRCSLANTKRTRVESAKVSSDSSRPPVPSSAFTFSLTDLPDALLLEILLRLPVKSAFRYKSLSKRCCSLISGYYSSTPAFTLMFQHEKYVGGRSRSFQLISDHPSLCEANKRKDFDLSFLPFFPRRTNEKNYEEELKRTLSLTKLEATCNDLLLCSFAGNIEDLSLESSVVHYYICNVASRQFLELPTAPAASPPLSLSHQRFDIVGFLAEEKGVGFPGSGGICGSLALSRYAVVRIESVGYDDKCSEFEVLIFCSDTGWCSTFVLSTYPIRLSQFIPGSRLIAYKDKLHLLTEKRIIVLDPFKDRERFSRIIGLPRNGRAYGPQGFGVGGSCLRVAGLTVYDDGYGDLDDPSLSIWELEDYEKGTWCLAFKISLLDIEGDKTPRIINKKTRSIVIGHLFFCVAAFHPDDRDIVYLREGIDVIRLNMRTRREEAMYPIQGLDPLFYQNQALLCPETAFQLVHRWSHNPGG